MLLLSLCFSWGGCKSTAQLGLGISESTETISDSLLRDEQTNFSTELHRDFSSEDILDELIIIKLDSFPVSFDWLAKEVAGISNGLVIHRKQKRIKKNDYQQQALETRLQTTTKEVVEKKQLKKEIQQPKRSNQKIAGYLFLSIFLLVVVSVLSNFYRKK